MTQPLYPDDYSSGSRLVAWTMAAGANLIAWAESVPTGAAVTAMSIAVGFLCWAYQQVQQAKIRADRDRKLADIEVLKARLAADPKGFEERLAESIRVAEDNAKRIAESERRVAQLEADVADCHGHRDLLRDRLEEVARAILRRDGLYSGATPDPDAPPPIPPRPLVVEPGPTRPEPGVPN